MFILTIRNDRLGDLILALPVLTALRRRYPGARLGMVVHPDLTELFRMVEVDVDVWPDGPEQPARLKSDRPDIALFLYPDRRWARAARRARIPRRVGTRYRLHAWNFNERVALHRRHNRWHEALCNLKLAAGVIGETPLVPPKLLPMEASRERRRVLLGARGIEPGRSYVCVHPGSRGSAWNWPPDYYARLVGLLGGTRAVVITGGADERDLCGRVAGKVGIDLAGETDLGTLAALLQGADLLVCGSTGPMHLAAAVGTPVVALFSTRPGHAPSRWGPLGEGHRILIPDTRSSEPEPEDMRRLTPESVCAAVRQTLRSGTRTS